MPCMEDRHFNFSITSGTVIKILAFLGLAWLLWTIRHLVLLVLTAIVIASAVEPGVAALVRRKIPRVLGVILIYLVLFSACFVIFYFFIPSVLTDFATFAASVPTYLESITRSGALDPYTNILGLPSTTTISGETIMQSIRGALNFSGAFSTPLSAISAIFGGVLSLILVVVFSFYFAVVDTGVDDFLRIITPKSHQSYVQGLWRRSQTKIGLWMQGQLLLGVIMGVLVFLALTIFGVPHALVLAVIAAIFEIIPVFGPTLAAVPAVAIAFAAGGPALGGITIVIYIIAQQFENHLIYPLVVTRVVGVPPLLVILALIVGGELAGFIGIILSVPAAATLQELARDIESGRLFGGAA